MKKALMLLNKKVPLAIESSPNLFSSDQPDKNFKGPF
jgi:hypothetical protein